MKNARPGKHKIAEGATEIYRTGSLEAEKGPETTEELARGER